MAKFHGSIGYAKSTETRPGTFIEEITEHVCRGDVLRNTRQYESAETLNDELTVSNQFSVVGNAFAMGNLANMRYLLWNGTRWKIIRFEVQRPRILLTVGGVYHGPAPRPAS